jgi:hypothetical protein
MITTMPMQVVEERLGEEDSNPRYRGQNPASYR